MKQYKITQRDTYIYLIKENIDLVKSLVDYAKKHPLAFDPNNIEPLYRSRAKHLQTMAISGLTCEHLIKLIVLKRGYSINEVDYIKNPDTKPKIQYADKTISFGKAIKLFNDSNPDPNNYFNDVGVYEFNNGDIDYEYSYLGYKKIDPKTCISLIQRIRNNYIHQVNSYSEWNGIIWYVYDFIIWLAKKEFSSHFSQYEYIGNDEIKSLFKDEK